MPIQNPFVLAFSANSRSAIRSVYLMLVPCQGFGADQRHESIVQARLGVIEPAQHDAALRSTSRELPARSSARAAGSPNPSCPGFVGDSPSGLIAATPSRPASGSMLLSVLISTRRGIVALAPATVPSKILRPFAIRSMWSQSRSACCMTCVEKSTVEPRCGEIADQLFEDLLVDGVEAREGLVEDDELGLVRDGAEHLDLLAHAFRKRLDLGVRELAETVALEQFVGALLRGLARESLQRGEVGDGRGSGHRLVESLLLGQVADARPDVERRRRAEYRDAPARRLDDVEDHADRRRLAGPVRPEEAVDGPARDRQAHVVDGGEVAEALRDILELEHLVVHRLPLQVLIPLLAHSMFRARRGFACCSIGYIKSSTPAPARLFHFGTVLCFNPEHESGSIPAAS